MNSKTKKNKPLKLSFQTKIVITPTKPFAFDPTFHKPDHFPSPDNHWQPGVRWQTRLWQDTPLGLKFVNLGSLNNPSIQLEIYAHKPLESKLVSSLKEDIIYRYNLHLNLHDFYARFKQDSFLGPVIKKWQGMRPGHPNSLYEYLIIGIVLQNATVKRSIQMLTNLFQEYGTLLEFDNQQLYCFWPPSTLTQATEEDLRQLKLGYRAKSIKRISDQFSQGLINEAQLRALPMEEQKTQLLKLYGVGSATVWYILFDVFHQYDFFDHISPWEQKIYSKLFFNQDPNNPVPVNQIIQFFDHYGKYRQLAVHYIWEDLWWKHKTQTIPWLESLIRL